VGVAVWWQGRVVGEARVWTAVEGSWSDRYSPQQHTHARGEQGRGSEERLENRGQETLK
jgi:hypothetical protein